MLILDGNEDHEYPECHGEYTHEEMKAYIESRAYSPDPSDVPNYQVENPQTRCAWVLLGCPKGIKDYGYLHMDMYDLKPVVHTDAIVVAVDGACRGNHLPLDSPHRRAAIGVYFHDKNPYNLAVELDDPEPTSQKAELKACSLALKAVLEIAKQAAQGYRWQKGAPDCNLRTVIVNSDSRYLVDGMTVFIYTWQRTAAGGFVKGSGAPVANGIAFAKLKDLVVKLNGLGVSVKFWSVPRELNREADAFANAALDGRTWKHEVARMRTNFTGVRV